MYGLQTFSTEFRKEHVSIQWITTKGPPLQFRTTRERARYDKGPKTEVDFFEVALVKHQAAHASSRSPTNSEVTAELDAYTYAQ